MPSTLWEQVLERVGPRGTSAYIAEAVARQLQRDALDDLIALMESEHGLIDEREVDAILRRLTGGSSAPGESPARLPDGTEIR